MKEVSKPMDVLVSVIIPTCRRPIEYLSRAIDSVRNQTHRRVEILVIDDSTATFSGRADIEAYMATIQDERVHYYQNEKNLGGSLTRNRGIEVATGQYITFLDDDDEYMPQKVEKQLAYMLEKGYDLIFSKLIIYSPQGKVVDYREYDDISSFDSDTLLKYHLMHHLTGTPTFMFKAEKLHEIGGFEDAVMGQEFYLMFKSILRGLNIGYFPECDVKVYHHEGEAISTGRNKIKGEIILYDFKKQYFDRLTRGERRQVRFRHYAVLAVAYKRNRMFFKMFGAGIISILSAPLVFLKEITKYGRKIFRHRK